jgi:hypothetical protein
MTPETWFVMEDGSCGDPRDVAQGADGILRHKDGRAVAYRPDGETPRSRGVDVDAGRAKAMPVEAMPVEAMPVEAMPVEAMPVEATSLQVVEQDMRPEAPKRRYKTREAKAG